MSDQPSSPVQITTIDILLTRDAQYWIAKCTPNVFFNKFRRRINGLGIKREEAIGDFIKQIKGSVVVINAIYVDPNCSFTKMWCELNGVDPEERL